MPKITAINQGDLLTFRAADNKFKVLLCTSTRKDKSPQYFIFAALTYDSFDKPRTSNINDIEFFGIRNRKCDYFKYSDDELKKMWSIHPETRPYFLGSYGFLIIRKDFMKFRDNFEVIGNLNIIDYLDKNGNGSMNISDWELIKDFFANRINSVMLERGQKAFKIGAIIKD
ncbi:hypothetical protein [Sphingobacterium sp.]|uniref:hypothetical protein n=1 Tax=Sphingobacterium sp. TaxID=341027 RepID=UPI002585089A|nr:hypothetical protein [Sphingobacterium sp.]WET67883.1 MAG: hypothetical protein P0Y57_18755 [Sphingobacterium sp.]